MKKRNIFKPISPKKIAALLSASLVMLPLTACKEKNVEKPRIEIEFCDTSDIKLDTYLEDYEKGKIRNGTEMYNYYEELFEILSQEEIVSTEENQNIELENQNIELENSNVTYNFNKELITFIILFTYFFKRFSFSVTTINHLFCSFNNLLQVLKALFEILKSNFTFISPSSL